MSPTLVFDRATGELLMATGSAGGPAIIHHTAKALLGMTWGLTPQEAANLPNFGSFNGPTLLEQGRFPAATVDALVERGHTVEVQATSSGVHTLMRQSAGGWLAGADPRREGSASGD
jgi:gamma-glutamyltranspeptidase/glutathione hydrolase